MVACPTYMLDGKMELTAEALHAQADAHAERHGRKKPSLLKEQLELEKVRQPNGQYRYQLKPLQQKLSFDKGLFVVIRALKLLQQHNEGVIMVGLAGASGSGKTSFSRKIQDTIAGVTVVSMDMYNDGSRVIDGNFDDPRISDYNLLLENLRDLREGQSCQMPVYDFKSSSREGWKTLTVPASRIIIIEGIYALSEKLRPMLDLCVSVTGGVHLDLVKRVLRDIDRSGQQPDEIIQQISDTVYPMYKAFIEPDLNAAHLRIYNNFNPFSGFMNATYILKSMHQPSEQEILGVLQDNAVITEESETFDIYLLPPEEDPETCQSWLRMRNRDGRYSLMFEESVIDDPFIISPRISFEVSVRVLGGLMALGYTIGSIMKRTSRLYSDASVTVKLDHVEKLGRFVQVQGKDREDVARVGKALGLEGTYMPRSYIEQVQLQNLTDNFQQVDDDLKRRFAVDGESIIDDSFVIGSSPPGQLQILTGSMPNVKLGRGRWPLTRAASQPRPVPQPHPANGRNPRRSMPSMHSEMAGSEALPGPGLLSEQLHTSAAPAWGFASANGPAPLPVAKPNVAAAAASADPAAPWPPSPAPAAASSATLPPLAAAPAGGAGATMDVAHLEATAQKLVVAVETLREQQAASSGVMQSHLAALQSQQQSLHATLLQLSHSMDKLGDALSASAGQLRSASRMASPEHRNGELFASSGGAVWPASSRMAWVILGGLCGAVGMLALMNSRPRS